jgi:MFS family permease
MFSAFRPTFILAHFSNHLVMALMVPLMPFIRQEFNLDYTQSGLVMSAFTLSYGISQLPAGLIADRVGPRIMITISICGAGLAGLLIGFSHSYILMMAFLVFMGVTGGGYHPAAPPLLASTVSPEERGKAFGFHMIGGNSAFFVGPLIAAGLASAWGWRNTFIALAIPVVIFGAFFYFFLSRRMIAKKLPNQIAKKEAVLTPRSKGQTRSLGSLLFLEAAVSAFSGSTAAFITLFAVQHYGVTAAAAAIFVMVLNSTGLWAGPLGGYLSDRIGQIPALMISCFGVAPVILLLTVAPYGAVFIILLLVWGALSAIRMPTSESYIMANVSLQRRSTVLGIYYFAGSEGSGIFTPILGNLVDRLGFNTSFAIMAGGVFIVSLSVAAVLWFSRK